MQQLRGPFPNNVSTQMFLGRRIEKEFQAAGGVAAILAAGNFPEKSHSDLVRDSFLGELLLGFSDKRDFGNGVNPVGIIRAVGIRRHAKRPSSGDASLLHRNRAEAGEPDDVSYGIYMRLLGLVIFIDRDAYSSVGFQAACGKIQFIY